MTEELGDPRSLTFNGVLDELIASCSIGTHRRAELCAEQVRHRYAELCESYRIASESSLALTQQCVKNDQWESRFWKMLDCWERESKRADALQRQLDHPAFQL